MPAVNRRTMLRNAEAHANRIIRQLHGRPALECLGAAVSVALFVLNDPNGPPKPQVMHDLGAMLKRYMAEFVAHCESEPMLFADEFSELQDVGERRPS